MDSISIDAKTLVYNRYNNLFTIVQESIRFEIFKTLVVYEQDKFCGVYRICKKETFEVKDLTGFDSMLFFGTVKEEGIKILKRFKVKGRISNNTLMAKLCLEWISYNESYEIKERKKEFVR